MLDLSEIDLDDVVMALEDHSDFGSSWWIDGDTGEVWMWSPDLDLDGDEFDPEERADPRRIDPLPSQVGYADMEDFIERVGDRHAADLLDRAIAGRGAFRRFKDTLFEVPELREQWFQFSSTRMKRRAIEFLRYADLISDDQARTALLELVDPRIESGDEASNPDHVAAHVAEELRHLYGNRFIAVVLYGSRARDDAHPDSDLDLAVILDHVDSVWDELRHMDEILWRHTRDSGVTISATPISRSSWEHPDRPLVRSAKAEGRLVA